MGPQNGSSLLPGTMSRKWNAVYNKRIVCLSTFAAESECENPPRLQELYIVQGASEMILNHGFSLRVILVLTRPGLGIAEHENPSSKTFQYTLVVCPYKQWQLKMHFTLLV